MFLDTVVSSIDSLIPDEEQSAKDAIASFLEKLDDYLEKYFTTVPANIYVLKEELEEFMDSYFEGDDEELDPVEEDDEED